MMRTAQISMVCVGLTLLAGGSARAQDEAASVSSQRLTVAGDPNMSYFLLGPRSARVPSGGCGLLVVLPGGNGGPTHLLFVERFYRLSLGDDFLVAQPIAVRWSPQQEIVWPIRSDALPYAKFSTEEFVAAVIEAVQERQRIDPNRIFTLSWGSSGPAAYAISLQEGSPVVGSYVAMSVFEPEKLGSLERAASQAYFIDHCPQDRECPFRMATEARRALAAAGAAVQLNTYAGGHGWQGDVFARITRGMRWLQENARPAGTTWAGRLAGQADPFAANLVFHEDFERIGQWRQGAKIEGVEYVWDQEQAYQGVSSVALKKTADRYFPIAQWYRIVPCSGATGLDISVWVKAQKVHKAAIGIQFRDSVGRSLGRQEALSLGGHEPSDPPADHGWRLYEGTVDVPTGTESIIVGLQIYGPGAVWFDALDIRRK